MSGRRGGQGGLGVRLTGQSDIFSIVISLLDTLWFSICSQFEMSFKHGCVGMLSSVYLKHSKGTIFQFFFSFHFSTKFQVI